MDRIEVELGLLRKDHPDLEYKDRWVRIPRFKLPVGIWNADSVELCFEIPAGYPGQAPYGFYVRPEILLKGPNGQAAVPGAYASGQQTVFGPGWGKFSWQHDGWRPTADLVSGSNLAGFVRTALDRLMEAA